MNTDQTLLSHLDSQSDELEQAHFTSEEQIILKGTVLTEFEFGASMRLRHAEEKKSSAFGILLQYATQEKLRIQFIKQDESWKLTIISEGIAPVVNHVLTLSNGFKPEHWHTLSITQQEEQIQLFLDEEYILAISETARIAQPGLIIQHAAADFAGIWQKDLRS